MIRDFNIVLKNLDGSELLDESQKPARLGKLTIDALMAPTEKGVTGEQKLQRYTLAHRIYDNPLTELTAEDISLCKRLIGDGYGPIVVGQAYQILDTDPTA